MKLKYWGRAKGEFEKGKGLGKWKNKNNFLGGKKHACLSLQCPLTFLLFPPNNPSSPYNSLHFQSHHHSAKL